MNQEIERESVGQSYFLTYGEIQALSTENILHHLQRTIAFRRTIEVDHPHYDCYMAIVDVCWQVVAGRTSGLPPAQLALMCRSFIQRWDTYISAARNHLSDIVMRDYVRALNSESPEPETDPSQFDDAVDQPNPLATWGLPDSDSEDDLDDDGIPVNIPCFSRAENAPPTYSESTEHVVLENAEGIQNPHPSEMCLPPPPPYDPIRMRIENMSMSREGILSISGMSFDIPAQTTSPSAVRQLTSRLSALFLSTLSRQPPESESPPETSIMPGPCFP